MLTGRGAVGAAAAGAALTLLVGCGTTVRNPPAQATGNESLALPSAGTSTSPTRAAGPGPSSGPITPESTLASRTSGPATIGSTTSPSSGPTKSHASNAVTGPLTIGFTYPDNSSANASLGVATSASKDPGSLMRALVASLNTGGGLAGRKITVDYDPIPSTLANYNTAANAACAHFAEDDHVSVVIDLAYGNKFGMASCLAKHGIADFGIGTSDTVNDNTVGLFASPDWMTSTRRYPAVLAGLHTTGYLTAKNKIGIILEQCPDLRRAYQKAVVPEISRLGLHLVDTEGIGCTSGFASAGTASAAIVAAVLRFRSHGVDRVMIVSDFEQVALLWLANAAAAQGWRPGFMLSSAAQPEVMRPNVPKSQWPQLHGIGWSPRLDIDDPHKPLAPADRQCLNLMRKGGVAVAGWQNTYIATTECSNVFLLRAALQGTRGDARGSALIGAVEALGSSFVSPGIVDGRTSFGPGRHDGPARVAPFGFVTSCNCLKYTGPPMTAP